jgi:hypothetical protein
LLPISILMAMLVLAPATVRAAGTPEQACQAAKNLAAGKYAACRQNAEKNFVLADATKYANAILTCEAKFATAWQKAIDKATQAGATCPDAPLTGSEYKTVIDAHTDNVATALAGGGLDMHTCGNGTIEAGESCDLGTVGGSTSSTAAALPYGRLACGAGCVFDTSGCFGCPGANIGGSCWMLGAKGASCLGTCTNAGLTYDPATGNAAASSESCKALVTTMLNYNPLAPPLTVGGTSSAGVGCTVFNLPSLIIGTSTTADGVDGQLRRVCACH